MKSISAALLITTVSAGGHAGDKCVGGSVTVNVPPDFADADLAARVKTALCSVHSLTDAQCALVQTMVATGAVDDSAICGTRLTADNAAAAAEAAAASSSDNTTTATTAAPAESAGDGSEGDGSEGDGSEGDGSEADGSEADGSAADGDEADGSAADGDEADGSAADGDEADGSAADGSAADGDEADGGAADGDGDGSADGSSEESVPDGISAGPSSGPDRLLGAHTGSKTVTFTIVADEATITSVGETMAADDAETTFSTALVAAVADDGIEIGVEEGSLSSADPVAHVVTVPESGTTSTSSNQDSGALKSALPLLGVCVAAASILV